MKYKVSISWKIPRNIDIEVEAETEEEARNKAQEEAEDADSDMYYNATDDYDNVEGPFVEDVEVVK